MQRYFVESSNIINGYVYINGEDYHHITKVMRMKIDDEIIVCDNQDSYLCKIIEIKMYNLEENELYTISFKSFIVKK